MEQINIRKANENDLAQIQQIGRITFSETFAGSNTEENMRHYLEEGFAAAKLLTELRNSNTEFYLAEHQNELIGYLKLNTGPAQTEPNNNALEIERIYVLKNYHGQKVGQLLYEKAIAVAQAAGVDYVWLGVWEHNPRAINFYQKNGFVAFDRHVFVLGNDRQTDIMMKLQLKNAQS